MPPPDSANPPFVYRFCKLYGHHPQVIYNAGDFFLDQRRVLKRPSRECNLSRKLFASQNIAFAKLDHAQNLVLDRANFTQGAYFLENDDIIFPGFGVKIISRESFSLLVLDVHFVPERFDSRLGGGGGGGEEEN